MYLHEKSGIREELGPSPLVMRVAGNKKQMWGGKKSQGKCHQRSDLSSSRGLCVHEAIGRCTLKAAGRKDTLVTEGMKCSGAGRSSPRTKVYSGNKRNTCKPSCKNGPRRTPSGLTSPSLSLLICEDNTHPAGLREVNEETLLWVCTCPLPTPPHTGSQAQRIAEQL